MRPRSYGAGARLRSATMHGRSTDPRCPPPWAMKSPVEETHMVQLCKGGASVQAGNHGAQVDSAKEAAAAEAAAQQADAIAADNADGLGEDRRKAVLAEAEAATAGKGSLQPSWRRPQLQCVKRNESWYLCTWPAQPSLIPLEQEDYLRPSCCSYSTLKQDNVARASPRALS